MTYGNPSSFGVYNNSLLRIIIDLSGRICSNYSFLNFSKYSRKYGLPSTMLKLVLAFAQLQIRLEPMQQ